MAIQTALLLKGLGGAVAVGLVGTGIYFANDYFQNNLSKFDSALINHLEKTDKDIKFKVNSATSLSSFPEFTENQGSKIATFTVSLLTSDSENEITEEDKNQLKKINSNQTPEVAGTDWTWKCVIEFKKSDSIDSTSWEDQNKLVSSTEPKGFFNKLIEVGNKENKKKFIKNCGNERNRAENKKMNKGDALEAGSSDTVTVTKTFELKKENSKLVPINASEFVRWFEN